ncbi:MAG: ATP-binding protein [Anaerolineales bacterium]|nr:ATP-binding protein [Anaerolineales bacterium]
MNLADPFNNQSPYEELETQRRTRLVIAVCNRGLLYSIPLNILMGVLLFLNFSLPLLIAFLLCLSIIPVGLIARHWARIGRPDLAGQAYVSSLLIIIAVNALTLEGFYPILVPGYLILIVTSGMILRPGRSLYVAMAAGALYLVSQVVTHSDFRPAPIPAASSEIIIFVIVLLAFIFVAMTNDMSTRDLRRALDDATYDLVQANKKLETASEMKSQFTARTSHELRTPLSAMIVFTDLVLRGAYGPINDRLRSALEHVINSARHLKNVINDILDLSKIEAGELEVDHHSFELENVVSTIAGALECLAGEKGINFQIELSGDLPRTIVGDESRVVQVLMNLASNAVKFTEEGYVKISIGQGKEGFWKMTVRDTGPGIPEDQFEKIFTAYRQLEPIAGSSKIKGTGLGLAIARNLTQLMGGELKLESKFGKGSVFEVSLPLNAYDSEEVQIEPAAEG